MEKKLTLDVRDCLNLEKLSYETNFSLAVLTYIKNNNDTLNLSKEEIDHYKETYIGFLLDYENEKSKCLKKYIPTENPLRYDVDFLTRELVWRVRK